MFSFALNAVPKILCGPGRARDLGRLVADLTLGEASVLLVADPGLARFGITGRLAGVLKEAGHRVVAFEDIRSDPKEAQVRAAVAYARDKSVEVVVCLGGGSALDAGKLIAALIGAKGDVTGYRLAANPLPVARLPLICVPTTAGTGSEATAVSVLSDDDGAKYWYWSGALKPDAVVLDPELALDLPPLLTAACGVDALVHAMEAATNVNAFEANNRVCLDAIRLCVAHLPIAVEAPEDLDARAGMLLAATYAGIGIDNAGTGLAHNIAHALGSLVPIHHGRAVAIAFAATLAWSMEGEEKVYREPARAFGCALGELPMAFSAFVKRLGIDVRLGDDLGLTPERLAAQMARPENAAMRNASRRPVTDADLVMLAERVLALR